MFLTQEDPGIVFPLHFDIFSNSQHSLRSLGYLGLINATSTQLFTKIILLLRR